MSTTDDGPPKFKHVFTGRVFGTVTLCERNAELHLDGVLEVGGSSNAKHGFHVHQEGNVGNGCKDAKGHYNPLKERIIDAIGVIAC